MSSISSVPPYSPLVYSTPAERRKVESPLCAVVLAIASTSPSVAPTLLLHRIITVSCYLQFLANYSCLLVRFVDLDTLLFRPNLHLFSVLFHQFGFGLGIGLRQPQLLAELIAFFDAHELTAVDLLIPV